MWMLFNYIFPLYKIEMVPILFLIRFTYQNFYELSNKTRINVHEPFTKNIDILLTFYHLYLKINLLIIKKPL